MAWCNKSGHTCHNSAAISVGGGRMTGGTRNAVTALCQINYEPSKQVAFHFNRLAVSHSTAAPATDSSLLDIDYKVKKGATVSTMIDLSGGNMGANAGAAAGKALRGG